MFCCACSQHPINTQLCFYKSAHSKGQLIIDDDSIQVFPDTFPTISFIAFELLKDTVEIEYLESLNEKIFIAKLRNREDQYAQWHYFIESKSNQKTSRWWIPVPKNKDIHLIDCHLYLWPLPTNNDTLLRIEFNAIRHSDSPYFYEDWTQTGMQIWDLKNKKILAQFFPINTTIEKGDIIKGDYDEEVNGTPTLGTIVYENNLQYETEITLNSIKFKLKENLFSYDTLDLEQGYVDSSEIDYRKNLIQADTTTRFEYILKRL
ncbi:MAG: hypothetical protein IT245_03595 [Bacteroidia bacterium]|nr:hypothetical protein [Bacteroidia bacterium]